MRFGLSLIISLFFIACSGDGDKMAIYEQAEKAFAYEDYATSLAYFKRSCDLGFTKGCERAAQLYKEGLGTKVSHAKALELLIVGCKTDARLCMLAASYDSPHDNSKQIKQRFEEFTDRACELGEVSACQDLALQLDGRKAINYLRLACKNSDERCDGTEFYSFAGTFYYHNNQASRAISFLDKACKEQDRQACLLLGRVLSDNGEYEQALASFERSCVLGERDACQTLLAAYENDYYGLKPHENKKLEYRKQLCLLGDANECITLARSYRNEAKQRSLAESFYRKALEACTEDTCKMLHEEMRIFKEKEKSYSSRQ